MINSQPYLKELEYTKSEMASRMMFSIRNGGYSVMMSSMYGLGSEH